MNAETRAKEIVVGKEIRIEADHALVELTKGYFAKIDIADVPLVSDRSWYAIKRNENLVYAKSNPPTGGKAMLLHRLLLRPEQGTHVDHINGDGLDNRRANLRCATHSQNLWNQRRRKDNTSGLKGASFIKKFGRWQAQIKAFGKKKHLGYFDTAEEAHAAYCAASAIYHREFSRSA